MLPVIKVQVLKKLKYGWDHVISVDDSDSKFQIEPLQVSQCNKMPGR